MEAQAAEQQAYQEFLHAKLDEIRSGPFTVIDNNSPPPSNGSTIVIQENFETSPKTVSGDFDFVFSGAGSWSGWWEVYVLDEVFFPEGAFGTGNQDKVVSVTGAPPGTYEFIVGGCIPDWEYLIYNLGWDVFEACPFMNTQVVTVDPTVTQPQPEKGVFVTDDNVLYEGDSNSCAAGYLGLQSTQSNAAMCVKGERVTENTNPEGNFVDIIICELLGQCESAGGKFGELDQDNYLATLIKNIISEATVLTPRSAFECVPNELDPSHIGYPFSTNAQLLVNFPISNAQAKLADEISSWMFAYFAGETGEAIARQCLQQLGFTVWPGKPSLRVNMSYDVIVDPVGFPDWKIRFPDIVVIPPGGAA